MGEAAEVLDVEMEPMHQVEPELAEDVTFLATGISDDCWKLGSD